MHGIHRQNLRSSGDGNPMLWPIRVVWQAESRILDMMTIRRIWGFTLNSI